MPRRNRKGEGSVRYRKDLGMYEIRLTVAGKRKSFYSPGPKGREAEAQAHLLRRKLALAYGLASPHTTPTLQEWLEAHTLAARAEGRRQNTLYEYERYTRFALQHLGNLRLNELTPERLEALFRTLAQKGYSKSTITHVRNFLHAACERAVRYGRLPENPVDKTTLPRLPQKTVGREITEEELETILQALKSHRLYAAFYLLTAYGLRRGEVLGLMWPDIDFQRETLTIQRALVADSRTGRPVLGPTKTSGSNRTLPLTPEAKEVLLEHRKILEEDGLYHPQGLVFPSIHGTPIQPSNLNRLWTRTLKRLGLPNARIHDLRSTFITRIIRQSKNPKLAATLAGHKSLSVALQHYTRVSQDDLKEALRTFTLTPTKGNKNKG
ncbi:site-specific recombinase XerD [Thermus oshimai JL-2]|uniref:Site-specific recombinase XerD n=1 Tax=Thermus oshimai JL-2 TaxID=751945 RepID=K7R602_THEOS|nr:site-specific integrase [Thermus oshimai]AFV76349.1 site-specific recombinase XerD [Thermus oshimai JL-2]